MDWEDKFSSIVKETESNLARVRDRLSSSRSKLSTTGQHNSTAYTRPYCETSSLSSSARLSQSMDNLRPRAVMLPSCSSLSPTKSRQDRYRSQSPGRIALAASVMPSSRESPVLINVLFERMEHQAEMLDSLSGTVKRLEKDKNNQAGIITTLQDEVSQLNYRLQEHGVDMETERKLDQFKREMYSHLEMMQSQSRLQRTGDEKSYGDPSTSTIARELHESKRLLQEDCDSVRREIDHLKTRLGKVELEMHSSIGDGKDALRRVDRLDRTMTVLSENQRSQSHSLSSMVDERESRTADLGQLRVTVDELSRQVSDIELETKEKRRTHQQPFNSNRKPTPSKNKHTRTTVNGYSGDVKKKSKRKKQPLSLDVSLSDSDLDLSSTLLDLSTASDSELSSVQLDSLSTATANRVHANGEFADLSSTSLSSLDSDDLLDGLSL